jgi:hypothetical protein
MSKVEYGLFNSVKEHFGEVMAADLIEQLYTGTNRVPNLAVVDVKVRGENGPPVLDLVYKYTNAGEQNFLFIEVKFDKSRLKKGQFGAVWMEDRVVEIGGPLEKEMRIALKEGKFEALVLYIDKGGDLKLVRDFTKSWFKYFR